MKAKRVILAAVGLLVLAELLFILRCDRGRGHAYWLDETRSRGTQIVNAIEAHLAANGRFPADLAEVGGDRPDLAPTVGTRKWKYTVLEQGRRYVLSAPLEPSGYPAVFYIREAGGGRWCLDQ